VSARMLESSKNDAYGPLSWRHKKMVGEGNQGDTSSIRTESSTTLYGGWCQWQGNGSVVTKWCALCVAPCALLQLLQCCILQLQLPLRLRLQFLVLLMLPSPLQKQVCHIVLSTLALAAEHDDKLTLLAAVFSGPTQRCPVAQLCARIPDEVPATGGCAARG